MPNLIVILFNLMYSIFVVGIYCKSCVIVRESVKTQAIEARRVFASISRLTSSHEMVFRQKLDFSQNHTKTFATVSLLIRD